MGGRIAMKQSILLAAVVTLLVTPMRNQKQLDMTPAPRTPASVQKQVHAIITTTTPKTQPIENVLSSSLGKDAIGAKLQEGFGIVARTTKTDRHELDQFLKGLDENPEFAREMISVGLKRLPKTPRFALERAGLLDLVVRYSSQNETWAKAVLEMELVEVPARPRIKRELAGTEAEMNEAMSVTPEVARVQLAFDNLLSLSQNDCGGLSMSVERILRAQQDELIRQNVSRRYMHTCPGHLVKGLSHEDRS